ncbi:spore germination cell wall hydrolase CwlJ-like protein [Sphingomonas faeni]|uniref:Spore germination cell wall hydrolase CwlJ-like protein n=1 Tax=Sphingomonas faeni TaxID=185950 RepID=A0A2T5TYT1_9SPHN|nr:cell wall hydrolase [Sphingomonas faeni]PTW44379.1 spore germination cell wall hydrolase CwlJ-like protein [Sphingomonas faeni]
MTAELSARGTNVLRATLVGISALAIVGPALVVANPPTIVHASKRVKLPAGRVVPQAEVPEVEPVKFVDLSPEDARAFNATVPFSTDPNPAARPFRFAGGPEDLARATDCMAAGILYEAGDDTLGERAVAQVVLNRLHHPAFPKTVCGVVFEGQDRSTGCQFSFSCDGALKRWHPTGDAWRRAREVAAASLSGAVFKQVGYATHYHTDWVVPYWQSSLDKITAVNTHLFFRWSGWWGTPPAFGRHPETVEPVIAQLAELSDAHKTGAALAEADAALAEASIAMGFGPVTETTAAPAAPVDGDTILVALPRGQTSDGLIALAAQACGDKPFCRYMAWTDGSKAATSLPLAPAQTAALGFSYLRDRSSNYEKSLWNCRQFKRADPAQCMKVQATLTAVPVPAAVVPAGPVAVELNGVRRKTVVAAPPLQTTPSTPAATPK